MQPSYPNLVDRAHQQAKHGRNPFRDKLLSRLMRASPAFFAHLVITGDQRPPFNGRFLIGPHHKAWDALVLHQNRFVAVAARGLGKTTYFTKAVMIWKSIMQPGHAGLLIGSTDDNSKKQLGSIRDEISENPILRWLVPTGAGHRTWSTHELQFANGSRLAAKSAGSQLRGWHPDTTAGDDVMTEDAKTSEVYLRRLIEWWLGTVTNLPLPGQQLWLTGTTLSRRDLIYGELRNNPRYVYSCFPVLNDAGQSAWPEQFSLQSIEEKRQEMGSLVFDTEMMCRPISSETSLFPRSVFEANDQMVHSAVMGNAPQWHNAGLRIFFGVDLAFSVAKNADYFVIFVLGVDAFWNFWWLDYHRERGVPYKRQEELVKEWGAVWQPELVHIESNAAQRILGDELIRTSALPIRKFVTNTNKYSFEGGLPQLRRMAENGKWRIPRGDQASREKSDLVLHELSGFTFDANSRLLSLGEHDDVPMALWVCWVAAMRGMGQGVYLDGQERPTDVPTAPLTGGPPAPIARNPADPVAQSVHSILQDAGFR